MTNAELGIPEYAERKKRKASIYKKPQSIKQLEADYKVWHYSRIKCDERTKCDFKFSDKDTNSLTKSIMAWFKINGHFAARINSQGTYNAKLGKFIKSGSTKGMADINAVVKGKSISVEVKFGKDKQSDKQKEIQAEIEAAQGVYLIAKDFGDFLSQIQNYLC